MKKFIVGLFIVGLMGFAAAQTTSVTYQLSQGASGVVVVEHSRLLTADIGVSLGAAVSVASFGVDLLLGLNQVVWDADGADVSLVARLGVPVFNGSAVSVGQAYVQLGLSLLPEKGDSPLVPVFEVGASSVIDSSTLTRLPGLYFKVGLAHRF